MPKEEQMVIGKIQVRPNVLYPGQSRFEYRTNDGSRFVIGFNLKNIVPDTITYIVRLFLLISEKETKFIKEFAFDSSYVSNIKINRLFRQISNGKFRKCPHNYEEFNNEVSKEIISYILDNNNKSLKSGDAAVPPPTVSLVAATSSSTGPQANLTINNYDGTGITYTTFFNDITNTFEASVSGNSFSTFTNVSIPKYIKDTNNNSYTVTNIDYNSFASSIYLSGIVIPDSVTTIGQGSFKNCSGLDSVILPNNSSFNTIQDNTFLNCQFLTEITIYNTVTNISSSAFGGSTFQLGGTLYTNSTSTSGPYVYNYFKTNFPKIRIIST